MSTMVAFTSLFQKVPGEWMAKDVTGQQMAHLVEPQKPSKPLPIGGHRGTGVLPSLKLLPIALDQATRQLSLQTDHFRP